MPLPAAPAPGRLRLEGSVAFTVEGPGGSTSGTAHGDGAVLRVRADDPVAAWAALAGAAPTGADALGRLADLLHGEGLAVQVSGPDGPLATVGAGADSALGSAVSGTRHVQPGRLGALRPLVAAQLSRVAARRRRSLLLAVLAGAALAVRRRRGAH